MYFLRSTDQFYLSFSLWWVICVYVSVLCLVPRNNKSVNDFAWNKTTHALLQIAKHKKITIILTKFEKQGLCTANKINAFLIELSENGILALLVYGVFFLTNYKLVADHLR